MNWAKKKHEISKKNLEFSKKKKSWNKQKTKQKFLNYTKKLPKICQRNKSNWSRSNFLELNFSRLNLRSYRFRDGTFDFVFSFNEGKRPQEVVGHFLKSTHLKVHTHTQGRPLLLLLTSDLWPPLSGAFKGRGTKPQLQKIHTRSVTWPQCLMGNVVWESESGRARAGVEQTSLRTHLS